MIPCCTVECSIVQNPAFAGGTIYICVALIWNVKCIVCCAGCTVCTVLYCARCGVQSSSNVSKALRQNVVRGVANPRQSHPSTNQELSCSAHPLVDSFLCQAGNLALTFVTRSRGSLNKQRARQFWLQIRSLGFGGSRTG